MLKSLLKNSFTNNFGKIVLLAKRHHCELPAIVMNNGNEMPIIGFGTWSSSNDFAVLEKVEQQGQKKPKQNSNNNEESEKVAKAVGIAIDAGYRHIDCAHLYKNEKEIGQILKKKIESGVVKRENLFITSKLWNTYHNPDTVCCACQQTLEDLGLEYLDMYLMHTPMGFQTGEELFPICQGELLYSDDDFLNTWQAMEDLVESKLCKNIGISNFNKKQIKRLLKNCNIRPQTLQIEIHPYLTQKELVNYAKCQDICITAYAPVGSPKRPWAKNPEKERILLKDYKISQLSEKHKRTPAQILLRYQIQCGHAVIPKSMDKKHIAENIDIFDFELSAEDVLNIDSLNHNLRYFQFSGASGHPYHPFEQSNETQKC
ncbi:aldo-keto reductase family 1 member B1-like [Lucilia cuprina]|uniref:aldo-keto reductase family 1 member B1-like n=1 Tax=Lucilia cuprina TaxID=7375 RepID=UPI001F05C2FF|nr:aldo-keto reductase family 1 member B1-like [Lucilia cuprina]